MLQRDDFRAFAGVGVQSEPDVGSLFWFEIPITATAEPSAMAAPRHADHATLPPCNILVAEDNPVNQKVLRMLLANYPHKLTFVANGAEAVHAVRAGSFDMVFMDVSMPVMDGPEATQAIRNLGGPASRIPIIALTANAMAGDREAYMAAGMTDYVSKPIAVEKVLEAILRNFPANRQPEQSWRAEEQRQGRDAAHSDALGLLPEFDRMLRALRGDQAA